MRKYVVGLLVLGGAAVTLAIAALAGASSGSRNIDAHEGLIGYQEVPALSTTGVGSFEAKISDGGSAVDWTLTYDRLEGDVLQSHIHFGQRGVNAGISVFLCTNLGNAPGPPASATATCPPPPATITGTFEANDVIGPAGQGIEAGAFDELVAAIRAGKTYANVHTSKWPGGEIRGQLNDPNAK